MVLIEHKLIDSLIVTRTQLIETYCQSIRLQIESMKLAENINRALPTDNSGYVDDYTTIFLSIAEQLGENTKNRALPRMSNLVRLTEKQLTTTVTKTVDGELWVTLYNRLGMFGIMSPNQIKQFKSQCRTNPLKFQRDNVEATLRQFHCEQEALLLDGLLDIVTGLSSKYASHNRMEFTQKIIISNAYHEYGGTFRLTAHEALQTFLNLLWRFYMMHSLTLSEAGIKQSEIWTELSEVVEASEGDIGKVDNVTICGIHFKLFKNKNIHISLSETILNVINDRLGMTRTLHHGS
ncbi:DUF4942 domain-containing protein [Vibrio owensii]|uniref:DUF4942 domain-containing protein n=1 Tax=Vibrio owensii TaxID=696485 RepID=UPI004068FFCD